MVWHTANTMKMQEWNVKVIPYSLVLNLFLLVALHWVNQLQVQRSQLMSLDVLLFPEDQSADPSWGWSIRVPCSPASATAWGHSSDGHWRSGDCQRWWLPGRSGKSPGRHRGSATSQRGLPQLTSHLEDHPHLQEGTHRCGKAVDNLTGPPSLITSLLLLVFLVSSFEVHELKWSLVHTTLSVAISSPAYRAQWYHPHSPKPDLQDRRSRTLYVG